jgi:DNA helicase-4
MVVVIIAVLFVRKSRRAARRTGRTSFSEYKKMHGSMYKTLNGELVKSGGERMIADYLFRNKIRYEYEKSAMDSSNRRIGRPDFYLSDYDIYVEYWGMVATEDGKDRKEYQKGMEWKMAKYKEAGIRLISIYPHEIENLDSFFQKKLKEAM